MSDVLHDEWDRAYEEGREVGRREAWSGDYDYRTLIAEARAAALRDAVEAIKTTYLKDSLSVRSQTEWGVEVSIAAIESLRGSGNPDTPLSAENPDRGKR